MTGERSGSAQQGAGKARDKGRQTGRHRPGRRRREAGEGTQREAPSRGSCTEERLTSSAVNPIHSRKAEVRRCSMTPTPSCAVIGRALESTMSAHDLVPSAREEKIRMPC